MQFNSELVNLNVREIFLSWICIIYHTQCIDMQETTSKEILVSYYRVFFWWCLWEGGGGGGAMLKGAGCVTNVADEL